MSGVESDSTPSESKPKAAEPKAAAIAKPIHKKEAPEPQQQEEDEYTELDALADQVRDLQAEVARLKLLVPAEADEGNDMLKEMQHEMATLRQAPGPRTTRKSAASNRRAAAVPNSSWW